MKLFGVIYIKHHLATAMFLWNGATLHDCQKINAQYAADLDKRWISHHLNTDPKMVDPDNHKVHLKRSDVHLACEWHKENPVKP